MVDDIHYSVSGQTDLISFIFPQDKAGICTTLFAHPLLKCSQYHSFCLHGQKHELMSTNNFWEIVWWIIACSVVVGWLKHANIDIRGCNLVPSFVKSFRPLFLLELLATRVWLDSKIKFDKSLTFLRVSSTCHVILVISTEISPRVSLNQYLWAAKSFSGDEWVQWNRFLFARLSRFLINNWN